MGERLVLSIEILGMRYTFNEFYFIWIQTMLLAVFIGLFLLNEKMFLPPDAKRLRAAKMGRRRGGTGVFIVVDENGHAQIRNGAFYSQGAMNISLNKREIEVVALPRMVDSVAITNILPEEQITYPEFNLEGRKIDWTEELKKKYTDAVRMNLINMVKDHQDFVARRCNLESINKPVYIVYHGKSIAIAPQALAELGIPQATQTDEDVKAGRLGTVFAKARELVHIPKNIPDSVLMFGTLLEPRILKYIIPQNYSSSVQKGIVDEADHRATLRARQGEHRFILPLMVIFIIIIIALVALKILGIV